VKTFSKTLIEYRDKNGLSQREMATLLGISDRMYAYYEKGEYDGSEKKVEKYLQKLAGVKENKNEAGTPIYDLHATASGNHNVSQLPEVPSFHVNVPGYEDCNFGMYVYGHSMYPTIESGSLILCRRVSDKQVIMYGEIYLIRTADYLMTKRLQKAENKSHVLCTSDNFEQRSEKFKRFEPFEIERDKIIDLYLVKGIIKKTQS
jgi:transcriptional regulator with XRE-family HTH domain